MTVIGPAPCTYTCPGAQWLHNETGETAVGKPAKAIHELLVAGKAKVSTRSIVTICGTPTLQLVAHFSQKLCPQATSNIAIPVEPSVDEKELQNCTYNQDGHTLITVLQKPPVGDLTVAKSG